MNLLNKKDDLINQIFLITKEALSFLSDGSFDDYGKMTEIYKKRQSIIDEINVLDKQIAEQGLSLEDYPDIKKSIKITIEGINAMDDQISEMVKKQSSALAEDIKGVKEGRKGLDMTRGQELTGINFDISK